MRPTPSQPTGRWRLVTLAVLACGAPSAEVAPFEWDLPAGVPAPPEPANNPTTTSKVELGRRLFTDTRLSNNGRYACSSCHDPALAFRDSASPSLGLYGEPLPRAAPGLANVGYSRVYTWQNPLLTELEGQALVPLLAKRPAELDIADQVPAVLQKLAADRALATLFRDAFPDAGGDIGLTHVTRALAAYERTLLAVDSPYDRFLAGDDLALSESAQRGRELFFSDQLRCGECHSGYWLTDAAEPTAAEGDAFHNTGLYNIDGTGSYPRISPGLVEFTGAREDTGKFRTPPLRNVAVSAPFMHDDSVATLNDVIEHYRVGGRTTTAGPFAGIGAQNPYKDPRVSGFDLSEGGRSDLVAFLESLTDAAFVEARRPRDAISEVR